MPLSEPLRERISAPLQAHPVVLFMKGERHAPGCGFSASVVGVLDGLLPAYHTVNVLQDPALRDGIKEYASWPTIPQLYVGGEFVGGADIVRDLYASGELQKLLGVTGTAAAVPTMRVTDAAARAFLAAGSDGSGDVLRLEVSARFEHDLFFGPPGAGDVTVEANGVTFRLDAGSARRADGVAIDFVDGPDGGGFKIDNPNAPARVTQLAPPQLQAMLAGGAAGSAKMEVFDVRTDQERAIATIPGARHLDDAGEAYLRGLDRSTALVFYCHHGVRSLAAAEHYVREGFRTVYNLQGGIDAWAATVDPSVRRY